MVREHGVDRCPRIAWLMSVVLAQIVVVVIFKISSPPYADEIHYHRTILQFAMGPFFEALSTYNEISAPLSFILYGGWGRVFGTDIQTLRVLSLFVAFTLQCLLFLLVEHVSGSSRRAYWLGLVVLLNPYMLGLNVVVYTDVLALLGLGLLLHGVVRRNPWLVLAGSAGATLSRQYMIFATGAASLYLLMVWLYHRDRRDLASLAASALSALPLLAMFVLWGGTAPPEGRAHWLQGEEIAWRASYLVTYVTFLPVYVAPVIVWRWRIVYGERSLWIWSLAFVPLFVLAPVAPSEITLRLSTYDTVGIVHRVLLYLLGEGPRMQGSLFLLWVLGLPVIVWMARDAWRRRKQPDLALFFDLTILAFMAIMPFSFHVWEKYLLPVVPSLLCRLSMPPGFSDSSRT